MRNKSGSETILDNVRAARRGIANSATTRMEDTARNLLYIGKLSIIQFVNAGKLCPHESSMESTMTNIRQRLTAPLEYRREDLDALAAQVIQAQTSLTGIQPKLSLNLHKHEGKNRLTIVGLWGDFIFKPQTDAYPELPENEDLTMHMAEAARIKVVPHSLIRLADGSLGYITRRIDRTKKGEKIDMEDMCQLTLHPTEYKYKSSCEQIAKAIAAYSSTPRLDLVNFMQVLLFSFVTGNNDMHLKNFSLYRPKA